MGNTKSTKRALFSAVTAMLICVAMLIGTTFAWFTDSASTAVNKIQAGTLDIGLEMKQGDGWVNAEGQTLAWQKAAGAESETVLWEPGCTYKLPTLKITNKGNLALQFKILVNNISGDLELLDALEFTCTYAAVDENWASTPVIIQGSDMVNFPYELPGDPDDVPSEDLIEEFGIKGSVLPYSGYIEGYDANVAYYTIEAHMKESAGNEYQGLALNDLAITIVATQVASFEYDSYDNTYDANAVYPVMNAKDLVASLKKKNNVTVLGTDTSVSATIQLTQSGKNYLDLNGHDLTSDYTAGTTANKSAVIYYRAPIAPAGTLTISGEGSVIGKDGNYAVGVERGTVNITGGTYEGSATAIYAISQGKVNISGGHFSVRHNPGDMDACKFTINKYDSSTAAKITITGGTFENFNPADNTADGAGTNYVADGYKVISEEQTNGDIWYTVVPE